MSITEVSREVSRIENGLAEMRGLIAEIAAKLAAAAA